MNEEVIEEARREEQSRKAGKEVGEREGERGLKKKHTQHKETDSRNAEKSIILSPFKT